VHDLGVLLVDIELGPDACVGVVQIRERVERELKLHFLPTVVDAAGFDIGDAKFLMFDDNARLTRYFRRHPPQPVRRAVRAELVVHHALLDVRVLPEFGFFDVRVKHRARRTRKKFPVRAALVVLTRNLVEVGAEICFFLPVGRVFGL
jgi:hypothetical protein